MKGRITEKEEIGKPCYLQYNGLVSIFPAVVRIFLFLERWNIPCSKVVDKCCSRCLFQIVGTNLEHAVNNL